MFLKHAYAGTPHNRVIGAADFKSLGVEGQLKVSWTPDNGHTAEVSDEAGRRLLETEPGDWEVVDASSVRGESANESGSGTDDDDLTDNVDDVISGGRKRPRSS